MKKIIEVEIGFPKSIVQYEGEPTSKIVSTKKLLKKLLKEMENEQRCYSKETVFHLLDKLLYNNMCSHAGSELIERFKQTNKI